jgi:hypothetical protein
MVSKCRSEFFDVQISKGASIHLITYKLLNEAYAVQEIANFMGKNKKHTYYKLNLSYIGYYFYNLI